ncbi:MAG: hypothetical protein Q4P14_06290 [Methanobacteriaceae archaeon]|nr:hypothetical protein [Methanobacteriaceae archaeon]
MTEHKFDWEDYLDLCKELMNEHEKESYLRTIISRFYYASFVFMREFLIKNKIFKNKKSKKILKSPSSKVHMEILKRRIGFICF